MYSSQREHGLAEGGQRVCGSPWHTSCWIVLCKQRSMMIFVCTVIHLSHDGCALQCVLCRWEREGGRLRGWAGVIGRGLGSTFPPPAVRVCGLGRSVAPACGWAGQARGAAALDAQHHIVDLQPDARYDKLHKASAPGPGKLQAQASVVVSFFVVVAVAPQPAKHSGEAAKSDLHGRLALRATTSTPSNIPPLHTRPPARRTSPPPPRWSPRPS